MPTYSARFFTEADWAETTIKAATPKAALARARQVDSDGDLSRLDFQSYDSTNGIERIEISAADGRPVAEWESGELRLRLAAGDLRDALEAMLAVFDLRGLVGNARRDGWTKQHIDTMTAACVTARAALAKAKEA